MVWPQAPEPFLEFSMVMLSEGAARSTYDSLLSFLRFLEEAGEVTQEDKLSTCRSLTNGAKEAALHAAQTSTRTPRGQAPQMPLALLAALESEVLNKDRPLFHGGFAWYRLLRHWAALRWSDSQALSPSSLVLRARGLTGVLSRTKTSGPGKAHEVLPIFVSDGAYLVHPWVRVGVELWKTTGLSNERNSFLPLPDPTLSRATKRRALYSDSAAFSQALLGSVEVPELGSALLPNEAGRSCFEHSDRAGTDSWATALGIPETERNFLGR